VVNSPGFIQYVRERGAHKVELVPNGTDSSMFDPSHDGQSFRQKHGLESKTIVMYAGAHGLSNDLGTLLEAAWILKTRSDVTFVLIGDGKDKPSLQSWALQHDLDNVLFLSPIPKLMMPLAMAGADACIAILKPIELYKTTYPNKVFDYMACGKPVILAIDGVIREVVEAAGAGIPIEPGNPQAIAEAVCFLADNPVVAQQMGLRGRSYVEQHFDRARLASKFMELMLGLAS
jgi:glycosyltransferase involved in cell wall biosynthesis